MTPHLHHNQELQKTIAPKNATLYLALCYGTGGGILLILIAITVYQIWKARTRALEHIQSNGKGRVIEKDLIVSQDKGKRLLDREKGDNLVVIREKTPAESSELAEYFLQPTRRVRFRPRSHTSVGDNNLNQGATLVTSSDDEDCLIHDADDPKNGDEFNEYFHSTTYNNSNPSGKIANTTPQKLSAAEEQHPLTPADSLRQLIENTGTPYGLGRLEFAVSYNFELCELSVKIIQAEGLAVMDITGSSDPYVKIMLLPDKRHTLVTKMKKKTLNPTWNETFVFENFAETLLRTRRLHLEVMDWDRFKKDDHIGFTQFGLGHLLTHRSLASTIQVWRHLEIRSEHARRGELLVSLCYTPETLQLEVGVLEARHLKSTDVSGRCNPSVSVGLKLDYVKIEKQKTTTKMRATCPEWREYLSFVVARENIANVTVCFKVYHKAVRVLAADVIGKLAVGPRASLRSRCHWKGVISNPGCQIVQWHNLKF